MNFHHEAFKMHRACIALTLLLTRAIGSISIDDGRCNYIYNHGCRSSRNVSDGMEYLEESKSQGSCSVDDIKDNVKFTVLLAKDRPKSSGILKANFTLPNAECNYEIALLVNSSITNDKDCKNHVFRKINSYEDEIHSVERTVCVLPLFNRTSDNCERDKFSMWYDHVFTGCYALSFTIDGYKYSVLGNKYIVTDYTRTEVIEPKFRCYYEDRVDDEANKQELVTFALSISVHAGTAGMILTLTPMSHLEENKENACVRYSEKPLYTWEISTDESTDPAAVAALKNCSQTTVQLDNETYTRDTECNFALRVPRKASYCLKIGLDDVRCNRQTIWKPPPDDKGGKPPCVWLQSCTRILKNTSAIEYNGTLRGSKRTNSSDGNTLILVTIAVTVVTIIILVTATILFTYRFYLRGKTRPVYVNTNLRDLKITRSAMKIENVETDEDEDDDNDDDDKMMNKSSSVKDDENEPIVLLYARGTTSFMNLMTDLREILKKHCGCCVRDWYDPGEWDDVARIGPSPWVADLLRHKHRAVWIDTPRARNLLDLQRRNDYLENSRRSGSDGRSIDDETIGDFRDVALPIVLDLAKRSVTAIGYNKHFVLRLEGFDDLSDEREQDPFEDLSPHTRYLIPHHLGELCSHLSSWPTSTQRLLGTEEAQLRERLVQMRANSQSLEILHQPISH